MISRTGWIRSAARSVAVVAVLLGLAVPVAPEAAAQQVAPPARVVLRADGTRRHTVYMSPGFNVFLLFDAPVEFVAVGDERLVSVYLRADDGIVGLRASQHSGRTNLHVYAGGIIVPFEVVVTRAARTADVVVVSVRPAATRSAEERAPSPSQGRGVVPDRGREESGAQSASPVPAQPRPAQVVPSVSLVDEPPDPVTTEGAFQAVEVVRDGIRGVFQVYRTPDGLSLWYQVSNISGELKAVYPERVLVKVDGAVARWRSIRRRPAAYDTRLLPHGGTEVGVVDLGKSGRSVDLAFPVFQVGLGVRAQPVLLTARFDGLDQLQEVTVRR